MISSMVAWALEALEDADTGVNAVRLDVPRADSEEPPSEVDLYSQNESGWVARGDIPPEVLTRRPVLLVRQAGEFEAPWLPDEPLPATIDLALIVAARNDKTEVQLRQLDQLVRVALRVLALAANASNPVIQRDGVEFQPTGRLTYLPPAATPDSPLMLGVLVAFTAYDPWTVGGA